MTTTEKNEGYRTADEMADRQRVISVSEFFLKNRHLLGFDSGAKALVTTVKEAVDNALDACEEAGILPELRVEVFDEEDGVFRVAVEDNGPGIVEKQITRIFGKLLYGSRFHKLSQSRGQQGMGIAAAGMYAQLTTGKPLHIVSRVRGEKLATEMFVSIDTAKNRPELHKKAHLKWDRPHGTRVEAELEGHYQKGPHSIDLYLKQTAIANPHVRIEFTDPRGEQVRYERTSRELPPRPREIKPHPHGVELGRLIQMLGSTHSRTLLQFLENEFSRVGHKTAREIVRVAALRLSERSHPRHIAHAQASALYRAIQKVPVSAPRTDCLAPIGEALLETGLRKEVAADFFVAVSRPPAVYRGNPFQVEVAIAYGAPGGVGLAVDAGGHILKTGARQHATGDGNDLARGGTGVPAALRQSRAVAVRAGCVRRNQGRDSDQLARLRLAATKAWFAGRAARDRGAPCLGVGAVHFRGQGGDCAVSRDRQGTETGFAGVRAPAGRIPAPHAAPEARVRQTHSYRTVSAACRHCAAGDPGS